MQVRVRSRFTPFRDVFTRFRAFFTVNLADFAAIVGVISVAWAVSGLLGSHYWGMLIVGIYLILLARTEEGE